MEVTWKFHPKPMQDSDSYDLNNTFSLLIQGAPGTGKTSLALQFPNVYVADLDNNLSGAVRRLRKQGDATKFKFDTPDRMPDPKNPGNIIERPLRERYTFLSKCLGEAAADPWVKTILVDGCSKLNTYICAEIGRQQGRKDGEMQLQDWNTHLYMWQNFVTRLQATSKMIVFTAHEEISDVPGLPNAMLINIQGKKIQQSLAGMFSDVWRTEIEDKLARDGREYNWWVRAMPTTSLALKNSLGLPDRFKMNWEEISKHIQSK